MTTDVGDTLGLFAAGIILLALFIASYSRRSTWLALGSVALSMAALAGWLFLAATQDPNQARMTVAWIDGKLPLVFDQATADKLAASLERIATARSCAADTCSTAASAPPPAVEREPMQAAATTPGWLDTKPDSKTTSQSPVIWHLDDRAVQPASSDAPGFLISGTNVSSQTLEDVHAVLKPDASQRELELALSVAGNEAAAGTEIPPAARFSLVSTSAAGGEDGSKPSGGAILTFRYVQDGQRKTSILYLTPSMVARSASRL